MTLEGMVHAAVWKELPERKHERLRAAMKEVLEADSPRDHRGVSSLEGSRYPRSYRLRVGRWRLCFIHLPSEEMVVFTTGFLKRRQSDYDQAVERHDQRVQAYE